MKILYWKNNKKELRSVLKVLAGLGAFTVTSIGIVHASSGNENGTPHYEHPHVHFKHKENFGIYDYHSVRRGFQVFREVCSTCHSCKTFSFRRLVGATHTLEDVKKIAANYEIDDSPNQEGEILKRPAKYTDYWPNPYKNREEAAFMNNGSAPPDFSQIVNTKEGMESYIFYLMNGYHEQAPAGVTVSDGNYYNIYAKQQSIAMPPPLMDGQITYEDGTPATVTQMSKDIATFLRFVSDPNLEERKRMATKALVVTLLFAPWVLFLNRVHHNLFRYRKLIYQKIPWK